MTAAKGTLNDRLPKEFGEPRVDSPDSVRGAALVKRPRLSEQTLRVLSVFASVAQTDDLSGSDIAKKTNLPSGTLYPILQRLEHHCWLKSRWEDVDPSLLERPRRRYYHLTVEGQNGLDEFAHQFKSILSRRP